MDKPNAFAPFVGPFERFNRAVVDADGFAVVASSPLLSVSESQHILAAIVSCMNSQWDREQHGKQDEQRFTVEEIIAYLRPYSNGYTAAEMITDKSVGIAAFTARNKESRPLTSRRL